ncbi:MAG: DUF2029 domain-containing protein [Actinomycetota bacterium]|nr:MAG: DUF2029 domain-containing protein [Actinomycetota bacterium]
MAVSVVLSARLEMIDLFVYRAGGDAAVHATALYEVTGPDGLPFTYPPIAALLFAPLAVLPLLTAKIVLTCASLAALVRVCWLSVAGPSRRRGRRAAVLVLLALCMEPVHATLGFGQVNLLVMWLVVEDVSSAVGRRFGGVLTGIAGAIKLVPTGFVLLYLAAGRRRDAVRTAATFVGAAAIGVLLPYAAAWQYWTDLAYQPDRVGGVTYLGNQSLYGVLARAADGQPPGWLWLPIAVALVGAACHIATQLWQCDLRLAATCVVGFAMLAASPISWTHHWVWFVPAVGTLWQVRRARRAAIILLATIIAATATYAVWWLGPLSDVFGSHTTLVEPVLGAVYLLLGLAYIVVMMFEPDPQQIWHRAAVVPRPERTRHGADVVP